MIRSGLGRAAALAVLLAVPLGACGDDDGPDAAQASSTTTTTAVGPTPPGPTSDAVVRTTDAGPGVHVIDVVFADGKVPGGVRTETVALGGAVRLRVTSDVADRVHVHTYDVYADLAPGQPAELTLEAIVPGRHEVELEERGRPLMTLEVR